MRSGLYHEVVFFILFILCKTFLSSFQLHLLIMGDFSSTGTSTLDNEAVSVVDFQGHGVRKSGDLTTSLYYYDEAADNAKVAEPIDMKKEQPKVSVPSNACSVFPG